MILSPFGFIQFIMLQSQSRYRRRKQDSKKLAPVIYLGRLSLADYAPETNNAVLACVVSSRPRLTL